MNKEATTVTLLVTKVFEELEIPYLIGGSLASTVHGAIHATLDSDLVADIQFRHIATTFKVDVFIPKQRPFDQFQFANRILQVVAQNPERTAYVASAEDTILAKLETYRLGDEVSDRQWRDILGATSVQRERLNLEYLRQRAAELNVADLLVKALT